MQAVPDPVDAAEEPVRRADQGLTDPDQPGATAGFGSGRHRWADWFLVALVTLLTGFVGLVGLAFLPWYVGPVPVPVSALLGVGAMILGPRACYRLTGSFMAAILPVASWFVVSVWLALLRNPMMPSVAVTVVQGQWRVMLLLGLGSLAAAATLTLLWAERTRAGLAGEQQAGPAGDAASGDGYAGGPEPDEPPLRSP